MQSFVSLLSPSLSLQQVSSEKKDTQKKTLSVSSARFKTQKATKRDAHFGFAANPADAHDSLSLSLSPKIWAMERVSFSIVFCTFKGGKGTLHQKEK